MFEANKMPKDIVDFSNEVVSKVDVGDKKECLFRLFSKYYYFSITK